jgi:hypothetical protein
VQLGDLDVARAVGEVDVEQPGGGVVGRERDRQQASLAAGRDAGDAGEGPPLSALDQANPATAFDDEDAGRPGRRGDVGGAVEAADPLQLDSRLSVGGRWGGRQRPDQQERECS